MGQLLTDKKENVGDLRSSTINSPKSGQLLMEALISIAIVAIVVGSVVSALILTSTSTAKNSATELATGYGQELMNNLNSVAAGNWPEVYNFSTNCPSGACYLATYQQLPGTFQVTLNSPSVTVIGTSTITTSLVAATTSNGGYAGDNILINSIPFTVSVINSTSALTLNTAWLQSSTSTYLYRNFSIRPGQEAIVNNGVTFLRRFTIQPVFRDTCGTGNISTATPTAFCTVSTSTPGAMTGIFQDPSTMQAIVYVTWNNGSGSYTTSQDISRTRDQVIHFNDWSGGLLTNSSSVFTQPTNQYATEAGVITTTTGALQL